MIRNQWYAILDSKQLPKNKPIGVTRMGEKLALWRKSDGSIGCIYDKCCHRGAQLSIGKIKSDRLQCPFHGFEYNEKGECECIPAIGKNTDVDERFRVKSAYPAKEKHGFIWIFWKNSTYDKDTYPEIPFFVDLDKFSYSTAYDHWNAHYSRVIENQLDVVHLPFVHHNTIGRGNKKLVNGPLIDWDEDNNLLRVWVFNQKDDGHTRPKRPDEISEPDSKPFLHFKFPNIWMNRISDKIRVVVIFAPIDNENTMLYLRMYQKIVTRVPIIKHLFNWVAKRSNLIVAHQDRRVVKTQLPKLSSLKGDEQLIQGDLPIVKYRRHRQHLIDLWNESSD